MTARIQGGSFRFTCATYPSSPRLGVAAISSITDTAVGSLTTPILLHFWEKKLQYLLEKSLTRNYCSTPSPLGIQRAAAVPTDKTITWVWNFLISHRCALESFLCPLPMNFVGFLKHNKRYWFILFTILTVFSWNIVKYCDIPRVADVLGRRKKFTSVQVFNFRSWFCNNCCGWNAWRSSPVKEINNFKIV